MDRLCFSVAKTQDFMGAHAEPQQEQISLIDVNPSLKKLWIGTGLTQTSLQQVYLLFFLRSRGFLQKIAPTVVYQVSVILIVLHTYLQLRTDRK